MDRKPVQNRHCMVINVKVGSPIQTGVGQARKNMQVGIECRMKAKRLSKTMLVQLQPDSQ